MSVDLPLEYYCYAASDPNAPEVVRDFLSGLQLDSRNISGDAPEKTYEAQIDLQAIRRYFRRLIVERQAAAKHVSFTIDR